MNEQLKRIERIADIMRLDAKAKGDDPATHARASEILALISSIRRQQVQVDAGRTKEKGSRNQQS